MLLRNAWYIGAWADELDDKPLARRICGDPAVMFLCSITRRRSANRETPSRWAAAGRMVGRPRNRRSRQAG